MYKIRFKSWDNLPEDVRKVEKEDNLTEGHGYDIDITTGTVRIVDPERPELYEQDASVMVPAGILIALAVADQTMTIEEV